MQLRYIKDRICAELNDASSYYKKAIDFYDRHPDWSEKFLKFSNQRQEAATELYKIFIKLCSEAKGQENYISSMRDSVMTLFSDTMRKIEDYEVTYNLMSIYKKEEIEDERNTSEQRDN